MSECRSGGGRRQQQRRRLCRSSGLLHKSFSQDHPAVSAHTHRYPPQHSLTIYIPHWSPSFTHPPLPLSAFPFAGPLISPLFLSLLKHTHAHSLFCSCPYRQFLLSQPSITCVFEGGNHPSSPVRCFFSCLLVFKDSVMSYCISSILECLHGSFGITGKLIIQINFFLFCFRYCLWNG